MGDMLMTKKIMKLLEYLKTDEELLTPNFGFVILLPNTHVIEQLTLRSINPSTHVPFDPMPMRCPSA